MQWSDSKIVDTPRATAPLGLINEVQVMVQNIAGLLKRHRADGSYVWHIDKRVRRYGRLCESTGTA
jgi:hypothetical protein